MGTLSGPLHGGANQKFLQMLSEIGHPNRVEAYIDSKLAKKEVIWGMGHREYKTKDPRATILQGLVERRMTARGGDINPLMETALMVMVMVERVAENRLSHKGI